MPKKQWKTAAEAMAELESDPEYLARMHAKEEERVRLEALYRDSEEPLIRDLESERVKVNSVWDLVNDQVPHPETVPILLRHLERPYPARIKEGIVRALAIPQAKGVGVARKLIGLFATENDQSLKWAIGFALSIIAEPSLLPELLSLVKESRHGNARQMLLAAIRKLETPASQSAFAELLSDKELLALYNGISGNLRGGVRGEEEKGKEEKGEERGREERGTGTNGMKLGAIPSSSWPCS